MLKEIGSLEMRAIPSIFEEERIVKALEDAGYTLVNVEEGYAYKRLMIAKDFGEAPKCLKK